MSSKNQTESLPTIVSITNIDAIKRSGIEQPATVDAWRWAYRKRHENGLADAFRKVGGRVSVDIPRFIELVRARHSA